MRADLNKLLCERERRGGYRNHHEFRRARAYQPDLDPEDGGGLKQEGMTRRYVNRNKDFNENLNPLRAQVRKAIGRPYAKFYSDLCKVFDKRSVINQHILGHLDDFLCRDVIVGADGELAVRRRYGGTFDKLSEAHVEIYVDPRDGVIKRNRHFRSWRQESKRRAARERAELDAVFRRLDDDTVLRRINDVWFVFEMADAPIGWTERLFEKKPGQRHHFQFEQVFRGEQARDVFTGELVYTDRDATTPLRYHRTKRTASHKLLKRAGLVA